MFGSAALFLLTPALTVSVVVAPPPPGPDDACPSSRQVGEAMLARFPDALIPAEANTATARPDALRSVLDVAGDGTVIRFSLVDARGETQLRRALPAPGRGRPNSEGRPNGECLALADTLAVIVERYLGGIASDSADWLGPMPPTVSAPPAAETNRAARRAASMLVGLGWRMPHSSGRREGELEARLGAQMELTRSAPRLSAGLSVGISPALVIPFDREPDNDNRSFTFRRFPLRVGALVDLPLGPGWVEPMVEGGADLFVISSTAGRNAPATTRTGLGVGLQAAVGYRLKIAGPLFLRPRFSIGVAVRQYDIRVEGTPDSLSVTPRGYASFGIDTGVLFR